MSNNNISIIRLDSGTTINLNKINFCTLYNGPNLHKDGTWVIWFDNSSLMVNQEAMDFINVALDKFKLR